MSQLPPQQSASTTHEPQDRLEDLIALETAGLADPAELQELAELSKSRREARQLRRQLGDAATAATIASLHPEPLPRDLRSQLIRAGLSQLTTPVTASPATRPTSAAPARRLPWLTVGGYAAAACLAILLILRPSPSSPSTPPPREALLTQNGTVRIAWTPTNPESTAQGDVVWSERHQAGYMRFANFTPNRPEVSQYQLWIFDEARPEATPVDGGVFDIPSTGEVIIPIHPKLNITKATLFAVTEEPPGGVVVSDRSKLHLIAARP